MPLKPNNNYLISHKVGKVSVSYTKQGRKKLLQAGDFAKFKDCKFYSLNKAIGSFSKLKNKHVFVKKSSCGVCDIRQLSDYLKQKKLTNMIPEVYGYVKTRNRTYVFSESINNTISIENLLLRKGKAKELKLSNKELAKIKGRLKEEIKKTGKKLIANGLLPWDFKLRQFFYNPTKHQIYFADNTVSFTNPIYLRTFFKKCNLEVPRTLENLCRFYNLNPGNSIRTSLTKFKKITNTPVEKPILENRGFLTKMKKEVGYRLNNNIYTNTISEKVIDLYSSLPLKTKQTIQKKILEDILEEIEYLR